MTKEEAIEYLADGHSEWTVECAREICAAFGLELPADLIDRWEGQADVNPAGHPKGLWLDKDEPGEGVYSLVLSDYIVKALGLEVMGYIGRGFQAQANARAIRKYLGGETSS